MPDHDFTPMPDSPQPQGAGHYRADDDIELPSTRDEAGTAGTAGWPDNARSDIKPTGFSPLLGGAVLLAAALVGGWFLMPAGSTESAHPNWKHVATAAEASDDNGTQLVHLNQAGNAEVLPSLELSRSDLKRSATRKVRVALGRGDVITATAELQSAQSLPSAAQNPDARPPEIAADSVLAKSLKEGEQELFEIELFDCCDEDGDIVEVKVNGTSFATVPIVHGGTKLSIPLKQGNNTVSIRGVRDGGGGVTLSFRTSRGDYYARPMRVGQEYQMGVVVR